MASKTTDWRPGPTVCRCCLTEGCYKDISTEYFWMGKREVYAEMLSETFSLSIAYSQSGGPNSNSRLICEPCISRLRDASDFRRQVQECEKTFTQYLDPATTVVELDAPLVTADAPVKVERVKIKKEASDDDFDDRPDFNDADDDDDDDLDDQPLTKLASKVPKKESVDLMDLLDNAKAGEKRKSTTKTKTPAAKKAKGKKEAKATTSKAPKPEKKKKDQVQDTSAEEVMVEEGTDFISQLISFPSGGKFEDDIKKLPNIAYQPAEHFVTIKDKAKMIYQALKKLEEASKKVASKTKSNDSLNKKSAEKNIRRVPVKTFNVVIREYPVRNMSSKKEAELQKAKRKADGRYKNEKKNALLILRHSSALPLRISPTDAIGCRFCTEEFNDPSLFRSHMSSKHSTIDKSTVLTHKNDLKRVDIQDLHCLLCSRDFEALKPLAEHLITEHELEINLQLGLGLVPLKLSKDSYICLVCDKKCLSYSHLGKHAGEHWLGHICDICGKGYQTRVGLDWHRREHTSMKHACQRCKVSFPNAQAKRDHISANKNCFPNKCRICKERLRYSEQLQKHLIEVHNMPEKMYRCEYCNIDFKSRLEQKYHFKRLHTDDTLCKYCEKRFCSPRSLRDHVNAVHTGERTVQCLVCNNFFVSRKALRWHATIHKPKTPCPVCGRLFARRHVLRTHVQKSHPEANVKI